MESHSGKGVVTFDSGETVDVLYSITVLILGNSITITGIIAEEIAEDDPATIHRWFGEKAVITLKGGTRLPILFNAEPAGFTATSGPL